MFQGIKKGTPNSYRSIPVISGTIHAPLRSYEKGRTQDSRFEFRNEALSAPEFITPIESTPIMHLSVWYSI